MRKQTKAIIEITLVLVLVVSFGEYYVYQKHEFNKRIEASDKMMKDKGIELSNKDKIIVDEILKNDSYLEYAYISHNGETIMLNLKFKNGIQDKDKYSKVSKYMDKVREQYKGKNVNATVIPNN